MSYTINRISVGQVGVNPGEVALISTDSLATITTAGYLSNNTAAGPLSPTDIIKAIYDFDGVSGTFGIFTVSVSGGVNTLTEWANPADIDLPTVANRIAHAVGTDGQLSTDAANVYNAGNISAGESGTAGVLKSFPSTASKGNLTVQATANTGDTVTTITNAAMGQASTINIIDPGAATGYFQVSTVNSDPSANLVSFDVTVGQAALAAGGSVTLKASSGSKQYKIRSLQLNSGGTNFSGGGGDRLGQVTDNTTVYSVIPAATMQSLANAQWGATALPNPASAAINTSTAAGASLVFKYSGGTTDYTAGSLVISGVLERVA